MAPSNEVKVHFDSTIYKSDEWISTQRLAAVGTNTVGLRCLGPKPLQEDPSDRSCEASAVPGAAGAASLGPKRGVERLAEPGQHLFHERPGAQESFH